MTSRSLAFPPLLERLERRPDASILDLGPAISENVSFLSALPSKLFIADLPRSLAAAGVGAEFDAVLENELPSLQPHSLDAILAWDLLNYLQPRQIESLGRRLVRFCAPGALLFVLMSTATEIPDRPSRFEIADRETLVYRAPSRNRRSGPRYTEPQLTRWLADFRVDVTYLLRNGMQEYLFTADSILADRSAAE